MKHRRTFTLVCVVALVASGVVSAAAAGPVMVERNLFAQDRKPAPPETASAAPQTNKPGLNPKAFQLDGVIMHGDVKKAIVRLKGQIPGMEKGKSSPFATVRENEKIGDYQVIKIEPKSISLEKDGQVTVVNLFMEGKVVSPVPPVPTSPGMQPNAGAQGGPYQEPAGAGAVGSPRAQRVPQPGMQPGGGPVPPGMSDPNMPPEGNAPDEGLTEEEPGAEEGAVTEE